MTKSQSPLEREKAERLLAGLRPPAAAYGKYHRRARAFMTTFAGPISDPSPGQCITGFRMQRSLLFGREYLMASANPAWFRKNFPRTDAIAVASIALLSLQSPPVVLVPTAGSNAKVRPLQSILEHEFVHINQIILGTFPASPAGKAADLVKTLFVATRAEYEANLLQLVRWPELYAGAKYGLSIDSWCAFRGYTQGLEQIVRARIKGRLKESEFRTFLDRLPAAIPKGFRRMDFNEKLGEYCARNVKHHVSAAFEMLAKS